MVAAIVALRVGVGLHFYLEGTAKLRDKKPFTGGFFANAKGPLAPLYRNMVWDIDGKFRLDGQATLAYWKTYGKQVARHFHFDEKQAKAADKVVEDFTKRFKWYFGSKREEISEYLDQLERRDANRNDLARKGLTSMQAHDARIDADRNQLRGPLLADIDKIWKDLENDLNAIATEQQLVRHGRMPIGKLGRQPLDSEFMDWFMPYFDTVVGFLLIVGLFTRPVAVVAGLFLASVCASQWPGSSGAAPIYYQFVEMLALFVLAAMGAGQFLGLDYVVGGIWRQYRRTRPAAAKTVPVPSGSVKQGAKA
ncbi:DoxX [Anatilimnocola aggregata]|uniref:DoxX n=1 Tax=Anatilimnocola aggregata TaxID=2528021 RepID=A0A517YIC4_9BACT|nr:DoxX family protein [Anatilimnocola aggregata]QDU29968.1 DoxX [Anatilimnocola aggregata]